MKHRFFSAAVCALIGMATCATVFAQGGPESPAQDYNMNYGWKFKKTTAFPLSEALESVKVKNRQFYDPKFSDRLWVQVSVPHAVNAEDSFDNQIVDAGEQGLFRGFMFYRKKVTVPESDAGKKFFLEFEAVRQSVYVWVNGKSAGYYEAGVTAVGFDISACIEPGKENLIAVATDNAASRGASFQTQETRPGNTPGDRSGSGYQWNTKDFNPVQGGLTGNVILHARGSIYQTLPLYSNLKTRGTYITARDFDFEKHTATVVVDAEVRNESGTSRSVTLSVSVLGRDGKALASFSSQGTVPAAGDAGTAFKTVVSADAYKEPPGPVPTNTVAVTHIAAEERVSGLQFWSPETPELYRVRTVLTDSTTGEVLDVQETPTGFREISYDAAGGGLLINGKSIYLRGYAQRSTNEWAVIGTANDWLTDYDMRLVRESNANYIRWMHVAPKPAAVRSGDKYGIVSVCPAGDKEREANGREWGQRLEAMRDAIIYFRNSPSVWFYEAGNNAISAEHMQEMTALRRTLDPAGGRLMGCRSISSPEQVAAAEWVGTMIWRYDAKAAESMKQAGVALPMLETEYKRDESPRRFWDDYTPPDYDYKNLWLGDGGKKKDHYDVWDQTQEAHIRSLVSAQDGYSYFWHKRAGGETGTNYYSGAAMMVWSDSNMHGRNSGSENCRTSGRVDPVRIPKESFYAVQVLQSSVPALHIVGHWNYPALTDETYWYRQKSWDGFYWRETAKKLRRDPLHKTVYVVATPDVAKVELYVNGALVGTATEAADTFIYAIENVDVTQAGTVCAKAYDANGTLIATDEKTSAGEPVAVRLTPVTGPEGFLADGADIAFFDVAVVDAAGNVCPTDTRRIDFKASGEGVFLGGYNSGLFDERSVIHKSFVFAECGTNRVFVRATEHAGVFRLTASAKGLDSAAVEIQSLPVSIPGGFLATAPQHCAENRYEEPGQPTGSRTAADGVATVGVTAAGGTAAGGVAATGRARTAPAGGTAAAGGARTAENAYTVLVNGTSVRFDTSPYRPDSATGVLCEVRPLLDALKEAGAALSYSYQTSGALPAHVRDFSLPLLTLEAGGKRIDIVCGETALVLDDGAEKNLTNAEFSVTENGELVAELAAVLAYVSGVSVRTDINSRTVHVTTKQ
ncbi:MAG: hypothetical protein K6G80_08450 [Treponema sp.]|nr:hypothetical protein [Treponema sp.]